MHHVLKYGDIAARWLAGINEALTGRIGNADTKPPQSLRLAEWEGSERPPITPDTQPISAIADLVSTRHGTPYMNLFGSADGELCLGSDFNVLKNVSTIA
jgi:hypothetical protein